MTLGARQVQALLTKHGLAPSRALGQNFVVDPNTARRIAAATGLHPGDQVLEIGPGLGSLTLALAELGASVTAIEIDTHLLPALAEVVAPIEPPVTVIHGDALTIDVDTVIDTDAAWRLAANLPYNIGTTIFLRFLADAPSITGGVVLVQREVAERLTAQPGDKSYGIPSVKAAWWATTKLRGRVPASVFYPRPRVESAFLTFERRPPPGDDALRARVFALVDTGFGQRRKMLRRALQDMAGSDEFTAADVAPTARAEELPLEAWVRLGHVCARSEAG